MDGESGGGLNELPEQAFWVILPTTLHGHIKRHMMHGSIQPQRARSPSFPLHALEKKLSYKSTLDPIVNTVPLGNHYSGKALDSIFYVDFDIECRKFEGFNEISTLVL